MYLKQEQLTETEELEQTNSVQLELLYKDWSLMLQKYAYYYLKDQSAAETIVNDVFIKLWLSGNLINFPKTYLYKSVKNACINYLAQQKKQFISYVQQDELETIANQSIDDYQNVDDSEKLLFLQNLVEQLPTKRQLVFKLYRLEGLSYAEIAELLQISVRTVEDHLSKSMQFIYANAKQLLHQNLTKS
jgi:RNA polymerase sigma-70 factor (family 1)